MDDVLVTELLRRLINVEVRIAALESIQSIKPEVATGRDVLQHAQPRSQEKRMSTRKRAITELNTQVAAAQIGVKIEGRANAGQNPNTLLRAVTDDGRSHRLYLAASGNYEEGGKGNFSAWHSLKMSAVHNTAYTAFILSAEDELNRLRFFCLSRNSMLKIARQKTEGLPASSKHTTSLIHFYPSGNGARGCGFTDKRDENLLDLDPYYNNWGVLTDATQIPHISH